MNNDESNQGQQGGAQADVEARIIAWVIGEASAAESAELEALVAAQPELAAFKARIAELCGLSAEAMDADRVPLRMAEGRRSGLLHTLKSPTEEIPNLVALQRQHRMNRRWMLALAACVTLGLFLSATIPSFQKVRTLKKEKSDVNDRIAAMEVAMPPYSDASNDTQTVAQDRLGEEAAEKAVRTERRVTANFSGAPAAPVLNNARQLAAAPDGTVQDFGTYTTNGKLEAKLSGGSLAADVEKDEPTKLEAFVVNEPEEHASYRASSTLAGTRVRTDLKEVQSGITVVTAQFLQDPDAQKYVPALGGKPKSAAGGLDDEVTTTASAGNATLGVEEPTVLSAFEVAPSNTKGSYMADAPWDKKQKGELADQGSPVVAVAAKISGPADAAAGSLGEVSASKEPISTFSLHVSDVSFRLAQAALARGEAPDPASIRPEEFYNAFNYGDPAPSMAEKVACHTEQSVDPVMQQRNLLRIAMRVPTTGHAADQALRLTVLLDTSGSMEREDRSLAVQSALKVLVSLLGRNDRVTLVGFSRTPRVLAEQVPGNQAGALLDIIRKTPPDGGTNLEEAIKLASELAQRQFAAGAQNRIVLLTDGAANLGDADPAHLATLVESLRQRDIAFDACGVGTGGIDDSVLEALTRKGSGRYYVLDSPESADAGFARQLAGAFHPAAENVKVQVRFNPSRVGSYRLIGFENHRLKTEDFHDDKVAAAALAGGEAAVALYEVEPLPQGEGDLGEVYVRFRDTATGAMVERSWSLPYDPSAPAFDKATPTMQLAATSALLAEKLRGGARADAIRLGDLAPVVNTLRTHYSHDPAVQDLVAMYQQTRRLRRE
jgi:Ca-activated chloride channel family protein